MRINETLLEITIPKAKYDLLKVDSDILKCLRDAGVDNWEGYDLAIEEYYKEGKECITE